MGSVGFSASQLWFSLSCSGGYKAISIPAVRCGLPKEPHHSSQEPIQRQGWAKMKFFHTQVLSPTVTRYSSVSNVSHITALWGSALRQAWRKEQNTERKLFIISVCTLSIHIKYIKRKESNNFNFKNGLNHKLLSLPRKAKFLMQTPQNPDNAPPFSSHIKPPVWKPSSVVSINTEYTQTYRDTHVCPFLKALFPQPRLRDPFQFQVPMGQLEARVRQRAVPKGRSWLPVGLGVAADTPTSRKVAEYLESPLPPQHQ